MLKDNLDSLIASKSGLWDNRIAFSTQDISLMLNIPLSTITSFCRKGELKAIKIGRSYRILRVDLMHFLKDCEESTIIL